MKRAGICLAVLMAAAPLLTVAAERDFRPFTYDFAAEAALADRLDVDNPDPGQLREIFAKRRARVLEAMPEGAMIVFSVERAQERRLEFQVPHSDNHDFTYLTGSTASTASTRRCCCCRRRRRRKAGLTSPFAPGSCYIHP